jgi:hypothetical protein
MVSPMNSAIVEKYLLRLGLKLQELLIRAFRPLLENDCPLTPV